MQAHPAATSMNEISLRAEEGAAPRLSLLLLALLSGCSSVHSSMVPPPQWSGAVGANVISRSVPNTESELIVQSVADIDANTYIWQPWFAPLRGGGGVAYERRSGRPGNEGDAIRFNGDISLSLLPQSRFPANISYSRLDSQVSGGFIGADFIQNRLAFTSTSIITNKLRTNLGGAFDWSEQSKTGNRNSKQFYGGATRSFDRNFAGLNSVAASVDYRKSDFDSVVEGKLSKDVFSANLSVQSTPGADMRNSLIVTYITDDETSRTIISDRKSLQGVNTFNWNPQGKIYSVDGFIRARMEEIDFGKTRAVGKRRNDQLLGVGGVQFAFSDRLHARFGVRAGVEDRSGATQFVAIGQSPERKFAAANVAATYFSETREFGVFRWRWGARAAAEGGWASEKNVIRKPSIAVNHTLERDIPFFGDEPARLAFTQEAGIDAAAVDRESSDKSALTPIISHSLSLSYNSGDAGGSTSLTALLRDARDFSEERNSLQQAQIQFNRRQAFGARRSFTGVLTANAIRRKINGEPDMIVSASGRLVYNHRSIFDARNLDFRSELAVNIFQVEELFSDSPTSNLGRENQHHEWRNILTYHIGKIALSAEASAFYEDDGLGRLLMFRIRRDIGAN